MLAKTEGIILRTVDYGEGNKILTVFTKEMGKIGMMARGARKTKSRLAAVSQPFILAHFIYQTGSGLAVLNQGEIISAFPRVRSDLHKTAYATYLLELTDRLTEDKERASLLYGNLLSSLSQIENDKDAEIIARIFELKILAMHGYKPNFGHCSSCDKNMAPWFFSIREGGLLCYACRNHDPYALSLGEGVPKLLSLFQEIDITRLGQIQIKDQTKVQLRKLSQLLIEEYAGVHLKTRRFLAQLEKMEQTLLEKEKEDGTKGSH